MALDIDVKELPGSGAQEGCIPKGGVGMGLLGLSACLSLSAALSRSPSGSHSPHSVVITSVAVVSLILGLGWEVWRERSIQRRIRHLLQEVHGCRQSKIALSSEHHMLSNLAREMRVTLDSIGDAFISTDRSGRIVDLNPMAVALTGWSRSEALGRSIDEVFPLEDPATGAPMESPVTQALQSGKTTKRASALLKTRRAHSLVVADSCAPIRNPEGHVMGSVLIFRDISEEVQLREESRQKDRIFRSIFEACPFPVAIQRIKDGVYLMVNPAFERVANLPEADILGRPPIAPLPSNRMFPYHEIRNRLLLDGHLDDAPVVNKTPDGAERHGLVASRMIDYQGETCTMTMVVDVTEYRRLQGDLAHAQRMDAVGQLAGGVAHDFNNMLGGILGIAEFLRDGDLPREKQQRQLGKIVSACHRAAELTGKLLAFARKGKAESTGIDVHDAIDNTVALLQRTINKGIEIVQDFKAEAAQIVGDGSMLMNALLNLGINASHAMPDGGRLAFSTQNTFLDEAHCRSSAFELSPGEYLVVEVADTGTGIAPEHLSRIFTPYFTTKAAGKGTGLGLAAVYGIMKQHHGAIEVSSTPGFGTVFRLLFPVAAVQVKPQRAIERPLPGTGTILLIDDEEIIQSAAQAILQRLGYEVLVARDGMEGLATFAKYQEDIDLVLLDMVMPGMGGRECFYRLRALDPEVRVLLASGFSQSGDLAAILRDGALGLLRKPYNTLDLSRAVLESIQKECV